MTRFDRPTKFVVWYWCCWSHMNISCQAFQSHDLISMYTEQKYQFHQHLLDTFICTKVTCAPFLDVTFILGYFLKVGYWRKSYFDKVSDVDNRR